MKKKETVEVFRKVNDIDPFAYRDMPMEIINKRHREIYSHERVELAAYIRFDVKSVYFSAGAVRDFGLSSDLTINFVGDHTEWMFYADTNKDGFPLLERKGKQALLIMSSALTTLFAKRTKRSLPAKYPLVITNCKHNGNPLISIDLSRPME